MKKCMRKSFTIYLILAVLLTMLPATAVFLYATAPCSPFPATGATLWTAFLAYLLLRGAGLTLCYRRKLRSTPSR